MVRPSIDEINSSTGVPFHRVITPKFTHYLMDSPAGVFGVAVYKRDGGFQVYCPILTGDFDASSIASLIAGDPDRSVFVYGRTTFKPDSPLRLKSILDAARLTMPNPELALSCCQAVATLSLADGSSSDHWEYQAVDLNHHHRVGGGKDLIDFFSTASLDPLMMLATLIASESSSYLPVAFIADIIATRCRNGTLDLERDHLKSRKTRNPNSSAFAAFRVDATFFCWTDVRTFGPEYQIDGSEHIWWMTMRKNIADLNIMLAALGEAPVAEPEWRTDPRHLHMFTTGNDTADETFSSWATLGTVPVIFDHHEPDGDDSALLTVDDLDNFTQMVEAVRNGSLSCRCSAGLFTGDLSVLAAFDTAVTRLRASGLIPEDRRYQTTQAKTFLRKMDGVIYRGIRPRAHSWREATAYAESTFTMATVTDGVIDYTLPHVSEYVGESPVFIPVKSGQHSEFLDRFINAEYRDDPTMMDHYRTTGKIPKVLYGSNHDDLVRVAGVIATSAMTAANGDEGAAYRIFSQQLNDVLSLDELVQDEDNGSQWKDISDLMEVPRLRYMVRATEAHLSDPASMDTPFTWWARLSGLTAIG